MPREQALPKIVGMTPSRRADLIIWPITSRAKTNPDGAGLGVVIEFALDITIESIHAIIVILKGPSST
jgi:hypothetical protein